MARNFIIIEPDPVVCMDIEGMLIATYPDCQIAAGSSLAEIGAAIYNCGPDSALIVRGTLISDSDDLKRVVQTAAARGAKIVVLGDFNDVGCPASYVELPFTSETVCAAVDFDATTGHSDLTS